MSSRLTTLSLLGQCSDSGSQLSSARDGCRSSQSLRPQSGTPERGLDQHDPPLCCPRSLQHSDIGKTKSITLRRRPEEMGLEDIGNSVTPYRRYGARGRRQPCHIAPSFLLIHPKIPMESLVSSAEVSPAINQDGPRLWLFTSPRGHTSAGVYRTPKEARKNSAMSWLRVTRSTPPDPNSEGAPCAERLGVDDDVTVPRPRDAISRAVQPERFERSQGRSHEPHAHDASPRVFSL